jgi:hypothetical protein
MQQLPPTLLPLITDYLPLHHKLTHLTHISRSFPPLSPPCFRHDALEVTPRLLKRVKKTNTAPPHIGAVDTLLFECETRSQLDLFFGLLSTPSFSCSSSSSSSSSSFSSCPPVVVFLSQSVRCLFFSDRSSYEDDDDDLSTTLLTHLRVRLPLLSTLRLSTDNRSFRSPLRRYPPWSSLSHLSSLSLSLVNFTLTAECLNQLCELPLVQLDLHQSRVWLSPSRRHEVEVTSTVGMGQCRTLLVPKLQAGFSASDRAGGRCSTTLLTRLCATSSSSSSSSSSSGSGLERLRLTEDEGFTEGTVERWLAVCPSLVVLDMRDVGSAITREGEMESIMRAMVSEAGLPTLRRFQHCSFPAMFHGHQLQWSHEVVSLAVRVLTAYTSQLLTIDLRCGVDESDRDELMGAVLRCGQLTSLTVGRWWSSCSVVLSDCPRLPHLISLTLGSPPRRQVASLDPPRGATKLMEPQLASILDHCPRLQSLVLGSLYSTPLDALLWIDQRCPDLRLLHFDSLSELSSRLVDPVRWASVTATALLCFPSLVSLAMTRYDIDLSCSTVLDLIALLRLAPRLRFLHLDLDPLTPQRMTAFSALPTLRGLRLGAQNDSQMKKGERLEQGKRLRRCWRKAGGDSKGVAAQYSRVQHSKTSLWCSPHLRSDWIGSHTVLESVDDNGLLRSTPPTDQEIEDDFWSWGEDACGLFVESVDGMTGREAFFAAIASAPLSTSDAVSAAFAPAAPASRARKRKRGR